ncbi:MAG: hypothetical protein HY922_00300 [Elusimicrobia bacterium]|nr:hypothetical protein [Elusimicrobiota bacterium]
MIFPKRSSIGPAIAVLALAVMSRSAGAADQRVSALSKPSLKADSSDCSKKVNGKCADQASKKKSLGKAGPAKNAGSNAAFSAVPDPGLGRAVCKKGDPRCNLYSAAQKASSKKPPSRNPLLSSPFLPSDPKALLGGPAASVNASASKSAKVDWASLFKKPVPSPSPEAEAKPEKQPDNPKFDNLNCKFWIFGCEKKSAIAYEEKKGDLFIKGKGDSDAVSAGDVKQGGIGDCYYLASLAAVAKNDPGAIRDMIKDNGNGTYSLTFHQKRNFWEFWKPEYTDVAVTVDNAFPIEYGNPAFAKYGDSSGSNPELWTMVAEKAYAKYRGSYNSISTGGLGGPELELLTGTNTQYHAAILTSFDKLAEWDDKGYAITAGTLPDFLLDDSKGVVGQHMYYVKNIDKKDRTITMGNPWGYKDAVLSEEQFKRNYGMVSVNPID